jgi:mRNA interferase HigB
VHVISRRGLLEAAARHADAVGPLLAWFQVTRRAEWQGLHEVRRDFPSADQVGSVLIFNVKGNRYRLITRVQYEGQRLYVKALLTHAEYNRKEWLQWV